MTVPRVVACQARKCKRFRGILGPPDDPVFVCEAFPKGIPDDVLDGENLHLEPQEGDEGLTYVPQNA